MRIERIIIENFKGISKEIKMSFKPNPGAVDNSLETGYFKEMSDGIVLPNVVGIIGKNGAGKSTILSAVSFLYRIMDKINMEKQMIMNHESRILFNSISGGFNTPSEFSKISETLNSLNEKGKKIKALSSLEEYEDIINKQLLKMFEENSHVRNKGIKIEIHFRSNKEKMKASILMTKNSVKRKLKIGDNAIENSNISKVFLDKTSRLSFYSNIGNVQNRTTNYDIESLLNLVNEDIFVSYLRAADSNVDKIVVTNKKEKLFLDKIILLDGDSITEKELSNGTKQFLKLVLFIEKNIRKKRNNIILIDELDNFLHNKLALFLLKRISIADAQKNIQIIFTTHSPLIMSQITHKQGFLIEEGMEGPMIRKISSIKEIRAKSSFIKQYLEERISSHPSKLNMNEFIRKIQKWKTK